MGNGNDIKILFRGTTPFPGDYLGLYGMDLVFPSVPLPIEIYQGTTLDNNSRIYGQVTGNLISFQKSLVAIHSVIQLPQNLHCRVSFSENLL